MLRRLSLVLAAACSLLPLAARADDECNTCWTEACKDLSSYLPPCKPKKRRKPKEAPPPPDGGAAEVPPEPPGPRVSVEAATARSTSLAFLKSGKLDDALTFANQAVSLAPKWPDALLLRGQIYVALAGPHSELAALANPDPTVNYGVMAEQLKGAMDDYEAYAKLDSRGADQAKVIEALGELNARLVGAQKDIGLAKQLAAQRAAEQQAAELKAQQAAEAERQRQAAEAERQRLLQVQQAAEAERQRQLQLQQAAEAERQRQLLAQQAAERQRLAAIAMQKKAYEDEVDGAETYRHAGYALVALGAGLGGTALACNSVANFRYQELTVQTYATGAQIQQVKSSGDAFRTAAAITGAVAGVAALAGIPLIFANLPPAEQHFAMAIGPGSVGILVSGLLP